MRQFINRVIRVRAARMARDEDGQGLAEYALILGLIAAVCIGGLTLLGDAISSSPGFHLFD